METDKIKPVWAFGNQNGLGFRGCNLGVGESAVPDLDVLHPPARVLAHLASGFRVSGPGYFFSGIVIRVCGMVFRVSGTGIRV